MSRPSCHAVTRTHIKGPIFLTADTISQIIYYNNKKKYISCSKLTFFPKFYAETLNTSREVFVMNLGFNFQFKVMITIAVN